MLLDEQEYFQPESDFFIHKPSSYRKRKKTVRPAASVVTEISALKPLPPTPTRKSITKNLFSSLKEERPAQPSNGRKSGDVSASQVSAFWLHG